MSETLLRKLYSRLPGPVQRMARTVYHLPEHIPFTPAYRRRRWIRNAYTRFADDQRRYVFMSIARFCVINRPINGYYFEFGCHSANTMRMAFDSFHNLFDWRYVGFDSFEGLPKIGEIDRQEIWQKGKLKTAEDDFIRMVIRHGMPRERLLTVKGFYQDSLTDELKRRLLPGKAAVVYVDCDLYESTVPVLQFIRDFLQRGTIVVFDDWNCFHGDPGRGERRAFREFCQSNPELRFEAFVETAEIKSFIFLGDRQ